MKGPFIQKDMVNNDFFFKNYGMIGLKLRIKRLNMILWLKM